MLMHFKSEQDPLELIESWLVFNKQHLVKNEISQIPAADFALVYERVIPSFCYDNAFVTAVAMDGQSIVYGAALTLFGDTLVPIEHAWVRLGNGDFVDPTYQKMRERGGAYDFDVEYFALFEIPVSEYLEIAQELGNHFSRIVAMDFMWFRGSLKYKHYFKTTSLRTDNNKVGSHSPVMGTNSRF